MAELGEGGCGACIGGEGDGQCEFWNSKIVKARKAHECEECCREIAPGERYESTAMKFDGDFSTFTCCLLCAEISESLSCEGRLLGTLWVLWVGIARAI